jgi:hypothetical protein
MNRTLTLVALLLSGCADESTDSVDATDLATADTTSATPVEDCEVGMRIGRCPGDFSLPNSAGELISLHEQRSGRVAVIGAAEF